MSVKPAHMGHVMIRMSVFRILKGRRIPERRPFQFGPWGHEGLPRRVAGQFPKKPRGAEKKDVFWNVGAWNDGIWKDGAWNAGAAAWRVPRCT